ncbi:hypothetical protein ACMBCN_00360 [Candidatus Liberibacter asiaticus]
MEASYDYLCANNILTLNNKCDLKIVKIMIIITITITIIIIIIIIIIINK